MHITLSDKKLVVSGNIENPVEADKSRSITKLISAWQGAVSFDNAGNIPSHKLRRK